MTIYSCTLYFYIGTIFCVCKSLKVLHLKRSKYGVGGLIGNTDAEETGAQCHECHPDEKFLSHSELV